MKIPLLNSKHVCHHSSQKHELNMAYKKGFIGPHPRSWMFVGSHIFINHVGLEMMGNIQNNDVLIKLHTNKHCFKHLSSIYSTDYTSFNM